MAFITDEPPDEGQRRDALIVGALIVAVAPTVASKLLDIVSAFAARNRGVTTKVSVRSGGGSAVELELPYQLSPAEVDAWVQAVQSRLVGEAQSEGENVEDC